MSEAERDGEQAEPIDTRTLWLDFEDGETAISVDLTQWNAAMKKLNAALPR